MSALSLVLLCNNLVSYKSELPALLNVATVFAPFHKLIPVDDPFKFNVPLALIKLVEEPIINNVLVVMLLLLLMFEELNILDTFKVEFKVVAPETPNAELTVKAPLKRVLPEMFNDLVQVILLITGPINCVSPRTENDVSQAKKAFISTP